MPSRRVCDVICKIAVAKPPLFGGLSIQSEYQQRMQPPHVRAISIYLCHNSGMTAREMKSFFPIKKRRINQIITEFPDNFPELKWAVQVHNEVTNAWCEADVRAEPQTEPRGLDMSPSTSIDVTQWNRKETARHGQQAALVKRLKQELKNMKIRTARLEETIATYRERQCQEEVPDNGAEERDLDPTIIDELQELMGRKPQGCRYSERVYRFAFCLMSLSDRAYRYTRKILPLPARSQVFEKFRKPIRDLKESMTDLGKTYRLLEAYFESHPSKSQKLMCTIAVDAFAFRLFLRKAASISVLKRELTPSQLQKLGPILEDKDILRILQEESDDVDELDEDGAFDEGSNPTDNTIAKLFESYNNCFIYVLIPLDCQLPCMILHLLPASSGAAGPKVRETLQELIRLCGMYNVDVPFICADGDSGWNTKFSDMVNVASHVKWSDLDQYSLDVYNECRKKQVPIAVTDLLH